MTLAALLATPAAFVAAGVYGRRLARAVDRDHARIVETCDRFRPPATSPLIGDDPMTTPVLRDVAIPHPLIDGEGPYRLTLRHWRWADAPRVRIAYTFREPSGRILFAGDDYSASPLHEVDSDDAIRGLLGFLTLQPGDTDPDYFDSYTPRQLAFAESYVCECLQVMADDDDPTTFADWSDAR